MPAKKTTAELDLAPKVRVLAKLIDCGYKTEKDLQALNLKGMLKIPGITVPELTIITEMQKCVKAHTLYSYLGGGADGQSQHESV